MVTCITLGLKVCICTIEVKHLCIIIILLLTVDKDETRVDKLRSILSQWEFKYQVDSRCPEHLYVPEVHPATQMMFCEREDEGHVFKVSIYRVAGNFRGGELSAV